MITEECYAAIGKLAMEFSSLDEQIGIFATSLLGIHEWEVAEYLSNLKDFQRKVDRIRDVAGLFAKAHKLESEISYQRLQQAVSGLKKIATNRNTLIHGSMTTDLTRGVPIVRLKTHPPVVLQVQEINKLRDELQTVSEEFIDCFIDFYNAVLKKRASG